MSKTQHPITDELLDQLLANYLRISAHRDRSFR